MKRLFLLSLAMLCLAGCAKDQYKIFDKNEFEAERAAWLTSGMENYSMHVYYFCDAGPQENDITVRGGQVVAIERADWPSEYAPDPASSQGWGVTGTFDDIATAYAQHTQDIHDGKIRGVTIRIRYNKTYHYPEEVNYSVGYYGNMMGGYYYTLKISDFMPLD